MQKPSDPPDGFTMVSKQYNKPNKGKQVQIASGNKAKGKKPSSNKGITAFPPLTCILPGITASKKEGSSSKAGSQQAGSSSAGSVKPLAKDVDAGASPSSS